MGTAIPEGETKYVLRMDHKEREYVLWNAVTGGVKRRTKKLTKKDPLFVNK